ncbi:MAG: Crp/Fnr family transcriptional regulator [Sphingobacteriia bacterium]|nr:Crp/Fnr family transcriptional regulator [Sphingobacteriia bacterium]
MRSDCKTMNCAECFVKSPIFKLFSQEDLAIIESVRCEVIYNPDEIIYKQGTKATQIVTITSGLAKTYIEGPSGKNFILDIIKPVTMISGPGIYVDSKHHFSLKAVETTRCCFFDVEVIKDIIKRNPHVSEAIISMISRRVISYFDKFIFLTQKQVIGRVADNLLYLHEHIYTTNPMKLTLSFQDMAEMTGMTKDTLVRVLRDLSNEQTIIIEDNILTILDFKKLRLLSQMG